MTNLNVPFLGALSLAMIFAACVGIATDRIAYKPLRQAPRISLLITAIGISFFLQNLFNMLLLQHLELLHRQVILRKVLILAE